MKNDYYEIAYNNLLYLQATLGLPFYNDIVVLAQQVAEKMLKSVVERVSAESIPLMHSHNLRTLYGHNIKSLRLTEVHFLCLKTIILMQNILGRIL